MVGIVYALVSRGPTVLAEFTSASGNFTTVTRRILEKLPQQNGKMSYTYDSHQFHYITEDALTYMCMCDSEFSRRIAFSFLEDIKKRFQSTYGERARTALAYGMNEDFSKVLSSSMNYYSTNPEADKLNKVRGEIGDVKSIMVGNIEKVLDRGEKISLLVDKTEQMQQQSLTFKKQSTSLRKLMWWKNCKLNLMIAAIVLLLIFFLVLGVCGTDFKCK
eukprot:c1274_g1_i1.p1 GENE.c1274_g1_i1~~c1274_g1_i1.p1  ORF type:complete len:218 (-),score=36.30 c1274_g1_i1:59-712(-)